MNETQFLLCEAAERAAARFELDVLDVRDRVAPLARRRTSEMLVAMGLL